MWFQKISIPTPWRVIRNSEGVGEGGMSNLLFDEAFTELHKWSDGRRRCVELGHLVFVYHLPETARVWVEWSTFELSVEKYIWLKSIGT